MPSFPIYAGWTPDPSWAVYPEVGVLLTRPEYWNLAWLLFPQLDFLASPNDGRDVDVSFIQQLIDKMDAVTLDALRHDPDNFMRYWEVIDQGDLALVDGVPNHIKIMRARVDQAYNRMYPALARNVVRVDFKARRVQG